MEKKTLTDEELIKTPQYNKILNQINITKKFAQEDFSRTVEINSQNSHLINQQILWLSTGILTIMFSTITRLVDYKSIINVFDFKISVYGFMATIVITFFKMVVSVINFRLRIRVLDSKRKNGYVLKKYLKSEKCCNITKCIIIIFEILSYISFIIGIIFLSIFINTTLGLIFN